MKYFFVVGEPSGDLHASHVIKNLISLQPNATITAWGGDLMIAQNAKVLKHIKELAFMGFAEVVKNLPTILNNFKIIKQQLTAYSPNVLVLVDYPGFNLRLAKWAKQNLNCKIVYYISPQIWAWKENRVKIIKQYIDEMICILPFESAFYEKYNYNVHYVGHPLVEYIDEFKKNKVTQADTKTIALLPGSRLQEVNVKLPIMLALAKQYPTYTFLIAQSPTLNKEVYTKLIGDAKNVILNKNSTYEILSQAYVAIVTSGTATLETALIGTPQVVCYKGNYLSYLIGKQLIKVPFISLVNLIAQKEIVKELIQNNFNLSELKKEVDSLLSAEKNKQITENYKILRTTLLNNTYASRQAAKLIINV